MAEAAVQKAHYKIEFPMKVHQTKGAGVKLVLVTLMTARNDIRVHPISTLDNDLIQPDQLSGVESEEWNKYIFNKFVKKVHGKEGKKDFYVCHIAVSTVHKPAWELYLCNLPGDKCRNVLKMQHGWIFTAERDQLFQSKTTTEYETKTASSCCPFKCDKTQTFEVC